MATLTQDFKAFASTSTGHFVVGVVATFVGAGVAAVLKDPSWSTAIAGTGTVATLLRLAVDILDGSVVN